MKEYFRFLLLLNVVVFSISDDPISCIVCKSSENANCAKDPEKIEPTKCKEEEKMCVIYIDSNKETVRECGKEDSCKTKPTNCKTCKDLECSKKIYPDDRPHCIQCQKEENCASDTNLPKPMPCLHYEKDDKCFAIVNKDKSTYRGCMSDPNQKKVCIDNDKICKICENKNGEKDCNKDSGTRDVNCYKCSGQECKRPTTSGSDCKMPDTTQTIKCPTLFGRDSCYTFKHKNDVTRGCLNDITQTANGILEKCQKDHCNSKCIEDIICPQCEGPKNDAVCTKGDHKSDKCPEYTTSCYWCEDQDGKTYRGCGKGNTTYSCNYCYGDDCPAKKPGRSCYVCNENDPKCHLDKTASISTETCEKEDDDCVVMIKGKATVRGCASVVLGDKECAAGVCHRCNKHNCNGDIFPENRLKCFQCTKPEECNDITKSKLESLPCTNYDSDDKCFVYSKGTDMFRGCLSDNNSKECKDVNEKCIQCSTDNCNNAPFSREASLKCIECSKDQQECPWAYNKESAKPCKGNVEYWQTETCFTYRHEKLSASRGCTLATDVCKGGDEKCQKCEGDACNFKNLMPFTCIRCRNDNPGEEKCANTAEGIKSAKCTYSDYIEFKDKGCYIEKDGDTIIRGCLVDLAPELREKCKSESYKYCKSCPDPDCNNKEPPNNSSTNKLALIFLLFAFMVTIFK